MFLVRTAGLVWSRLLILLLICGGCSSPGDSSLARSAAESAERLVRPGMSVSEVVDIAAATDHNFSVTGFCGARALNVRGDGGDAGLVAWRGSASGDWLSERAPEDEDQHFQNRSQLREAIRGTLLRDSRCSGLLIGFQARQSWHFEVVLGADSLVTDVKPTKPWQ
jgi:hypothetical protein